MSLVRCACWLTLLTTAWQIFTPRLIDCAAQAFAPARNCSSGSSLEKTQHATDRPRHI